MRKLKDLLSERILVLDGAMGTMLQAYKFEEDFYCNVRSFVLSWVFIFSIKVDTYREAIVLISSYYYKILEIFCLPIIVMISTVFAFTLK